MKGIPKSIYFISWGFSSAWCTDCKNSSCLLALRHIKRGRYVRAQWYPETRLFLDGCVFLLSSLIQTFPEIIGPKFQLCCLLDQETKNFDLVPCHLHSFPCCGCCIRWEFKFHQASILRWRDCPNNGLVLGDSIRSLSCIRMVIFVIERFGGEIAACGDSRKPRKLPQEIYN